MQIREWIFFRSPGFNLGKAAQNCSLFGCIEDLSQLLTKAIQVRFVMTDMVPNQS